jgi:cyclic dehypoxanthinyl futalosine synthase
MSAYETILRKVEELIEHGGTQLLMQGLHPDLKIEWFEEIFRRISRASRRCRSSLSPAEVVHIARPPGHHA